MSQFIKTESDEEFENDFTNEELEPLSEDEIFDNREEKIKQAN